MEAGKLRTKITFRRSTTRYDASHQPIYAWADAFSVWAQEITEGGREFYAAQKLNAETTAVYRIRYRKDVTTKMQIVVGNRTFGILPPINDENGRHISLLISGKEVV